MNKNSLNVITSSEKDDWATPQFLFDYLNQPNLYGKFTLDPASAEWNKKCEHHFTKKQNGLLQSWKGHKVFINPPYTKNQAILWIKKAYEESKQEDTSVTMLLPARTSNNWFHDYCVKARDIIFIKNRIVFEDLNGNKNGAPFPSMIVHFDGTENAVVRLSDNCGSLKLLSNKFYVLDQKTIK